LRWEGSGFQSGLDAEEFFAPRLSQALWTLVNGIAYAEAVVTGSSVVAGKLSAVRAGIKRASLRAAVLFVKFVFADNTHGRPLALSN